MATKWGIEKLKKGQLKQIIRKEGPKTHYLKAGTTTMGGLLFIPAGLIVGALITSNSESIEKIIAISFITLMFMIIGAIDDWKSMQRKHNTGLTVKEKLLLQIGASIIFIYWSYIKNYLENTITIPFGNSVNAGILIWPISIFILIAVSNSTNLTDGLDGLASGCSALIFTGLGLNILLLGSPEDQSLAVFCLVMAGALLGFLVFNKQPAYIFMGDTGSLAIGASLSAVALLSDSLWPLFCMSGVLVAESSSVIIQVLVFKLSKKLNGTGFRVLKMAPLHHHFEITIKNEQVVVTSFWIITLCLVLISLLISLN